MDGHDESPGQKQTVVRGARACTVCRAAKMKCVPSLEGEKQCQRCKRSNVECIFEKHRRGRKPGSKLSEASKMLRRLEKGLSTAKQKSGETMSYGPGSMGHGDYHLGNARFDSASSHQGISDAHYGHSGRSRSLTLDDADESSAERMNDGLYPAKLISRENQRNSFFRTILNPSHHDSPSPTARSSQSAQDRPQRNGNASVTPTPDTPIQTTRTVISSTGYRAYDPISTGLLKPNQAKDLFEMLYLRLNPFINLFDPVLHTVDYVRTKCSFLFTTMIMAASKFFKPEIFKECETMANELAVRAFAENWRSVEVVQAFACMTYWKDPDDHRTWTYIGYACRMAVELNFNRSSQHSQHLKKNETALAHLERRNRERTYLILFVHDRSLSTQTGRLCSLPEDAFTRSCGSWHRDVFVGLNSSSGENGAGPATRAEDVIVVAFVQLRRITTETTDIFNSGGEGEPPNEISHEAILRNCNSKLDQWNQTWHQEMERARGELFHFHFLDFFQLYSRVFINSFGIRAAVAPSSRVTPNLDALSACCTSALAALKIISTDFSAMHMLRYGQESILVMSAYCAIFLLKLLRSPNTVELLQPDTAIEIRNMISKTADAYEEAARVLANTAMSANCHSRFLRNLVVADAEIFQNRGAPIDEKPHYGTMTPIDPRLQDQSGHSPASSSSFERHHNGYSSSSHHFNGNSNGHGGQSFNFPASPHLPGFPQPLPTYMPESAERTTGTGTGVGPGYPQTQMNHSRIDQQYWNSMFEGLGFGGSISPTPNMPNSHHQYHNGGGMQEAYI